MPNDMYFDTDSFDFNSLVDVVEDTPEQFANNTMRKAADVDPSMGGVVDDASDLPQMDEPEESTDPNDNINDLLVSEEDKAQALEDFNYLPDDFPIDFGGKIHTKAEVKQLLEKVEEVEAKEEFVSEVFDKVEQGARWIYRESGVGLLEINEEINDLTNQYHTAPNNAVKGEIADKLMNASAKRERLYATVDKALQTNAAIEKETIAENTFKINNLMKRRYSDYDQIMSHAINDMKNKGVSLVAYEKQLNPWIAEKIYKATKAEIRENEAMQKVHARTNAKATRSQSAPTTANRVAPTEQSAAEKAALVAKMKRGGLTKEENFKMFNFLKD
ncbi:hypothetical protein IGV50_004414 [Salmonella enterica subsp. enterica serovar Newport]|nr:hypothetical protein [Salmonella enterica subsp. enterica serovar Newport]